MTPRFFAIVPAAGHSVRMGRPKLLLPVAGRPLIAATIAAWRQSRVDKVFVVVRPGDNELADAARACGAAVIVPEQPPVDMKASIQAALREIQRLHAPVECDAFLVAPADMPHLSAAIINRLIEHHENEAPERILAPMLAGRRGHPVLFPWDISALVFSLGADEGLNEIVERQAPTLIPCDDLVANSGNPFADIDTPEDYHRLSGS